MDLSLLSHLSDAALKSEAARRGLDAEGLDRAALIAAIRAAEGQAPVDALAATLPPGHAAFEDATRDARREAERLEVDPLAATVPPTPDRRRFESAPTDPPRPVAKSAARSLLGKVVGIARAALERKSSPPPAPPRAPVPREAPAEEPIRTKTMALLLLEQGHLDRARTMLSALSIGRDDPEVSAALREADRRIAEREVSSRAVAMAETPGAFVSIVDDGARVIGVVWSVDAEALARGRAVLGEDGALTLRVVTIEARPDHSVRSHREDRRPIEARSWALLDAAPGARVVVSIGVAEGERFASVAHAASR